MQALSGLGTADAHEETIAATLRLKETAAAETRSQADVFVRLLCETWEPPQAVSQIDSRKHTVCSRTWPASVSGPEKTVRAESASAAC